ncbi:MAG: hypothetical protein Q9160_008506 [Pyrenula sp. 1 TL-2023]
MYSRNRRADSWVEISSQPSSSSLSSAGDEATTAALNAQTDPSVLRRRRRRQLQQLTRGESRPLNRPRSTTSSSQEEYEESESESDRVMNSSNEDVIAAGTAAPAPSRPNVDDDDDDDASTALGIRTTETVFTPQPHAFSHQLSRTPQSSREAPVDSYFDPNSRLPSNRTITQRDIRRPSFSRSRAQTQHTPYNVIAPSHSYQTDHDAALRASLSTLLSCAAAARGLPKRSQSSRSFNQQSQAPVIDPTSLRLVPESRMKTDESSSSPQAPALPARRSRAPTASSSASPMLVASPSAPSDPSKPSTKRKIRETSKDRLSRAAKKSRSSTRAVGAEDAVVSPTLMTWMISAGFVVLFSAASFAAGYVWGREVGRMEAGLGPTKNGIQCGREVLGRGTSLKRLRWGGGSSSARIVA